MCTGTPRTDSHDAVADGRQRSATVARPRCGSAETWREMVKWWDGPSIRTGMTDGVTVRWNMEMEGRRRRGRRGERLTVSDVANITGGSTTVAVRPRQGRVAGGADEATVIALHLLERPRSAGGAGSAIHHLERLRREGVAAQRHLERPRSAGDVGGAGSAIHRLEHRERLRLRLRVGEARAAEEREREQRQPEGCARERGPGRGGGDRARTAAAARAGGSGAGGGRGGDGGGAPHRVRALRERGTGCASAGVDWLVTVVVPMLPERKRKQRQQRRHQAFALAPVRGVRERDMSACIRGTRLSPWAP